MTDLFFVILYIYTYDWEECVTRSECSFSFALMNIVQMIRMSVDFVPFIFTVLCEFTSIWSETYKLWYKFLFLMYEVWSDILSSKSWIAWILYFDNTVFSWCLCQIFLPFFVVLWPFHVVGNSMTLATALTQWLIFCNFHFLNWKYFPTL